MKFRQAIAAIATLAASGVAIASPASATVIASTSFESPQFGAVPAGGVQYGPSGSGFSNPDVGTSPSNAAFAFGGYSGIISNSNNSSSYGAPPDFPTYYQVLPATPFGAQAGFLQTLGTNPSIDWTVGGLTPGGQYTLSFFDAGGTGPYVGVAPIDISFVGATTLLNTDFAPIAGKYTFNSLSFTADASSVTIGFNGGPSVGNLLSGIDNLEVSVPEPSTWGVVLLGLLGIGFMVRKSQFRGSIPLA